jgi:hypothetical protein
LETWVELFGFLPRLQLVDLLPQINDRHLAEAVQYFLLKCGKITLGNLRIDAPLYYEVNGHGRRMVQKVLAPDTPMPGNIKNFRLIYLRFFYTVHNMFGTIIKVAPFEEIFHVFFQNF